MKFRQLIPEYPFEQENIEMVVKDGKHTLVGFTNLGEIHHNMTKISGWHIFVLFIAIKKVGGWR